MVKRTVNRDKRMPTFLVELWNEDNYPENMAKRFLRRMWAGKIEHIQTKEVKMFIQVSQMLKFMEDHRVK